MDCVFCQIIAGNGTASIVYEDDATLALMDLIPITGGHLLVVPKEHYRTLLETPPAVAARVMQTGVLLAPALQQATGCAGMNFHVANEAVAGQAIFHVHLHLIPRFPDDGFGLRFPPAYGRRAGRGELDQWAAKIQRALNRWTTVAQPTQTEENSHDRP